jgi:hypothetical protein
LWWRKHAHGVVLRGPRYTGDIDGDAWLLHVVAVKARRKYLGEYTLHLLGLQEIVNTRTESSTRKLLANLSVILWPEEMCFFGHG